MSRYSYIPEIKSPEGKKMYKTVRYPEIQKAFSDVYVFTTIGDRYDTLALQYYGDSDLWWIISTANGKLIQNSLTPPVGTQIRIPQDVASIIAEYKNINE